MTNSAPPDPQQPSDSSEPVLVVKAVYRRGVIKPLSPVDLPEGTPVTAQLTPQVVVTHASLPSRNASSTLATAFSRRDVLVIVLGLLFYLLTRFAFLDQYPIYFFSDEAIQVNLAEELIEHGFRDSDGVFLPPFFRNDDKWSLSFSVYVHALALPLFGKSVIAERATSVFVGTLGVLAVMLTLKLVFKSRFWWAGVLVLAALPAWFLHSRTAFETVMMVAFYACFLCCYLLYRYRSPYYLAGAVLFAGATFYSYTNGQGVIAVSTVLLLLSDARYHWQQRRTILLCLPLVLLVAVPYGRFRMSQPQALQEQLRTLDSYWLRSDPLSTKLATFGQTYLQGINPTYWFLPNDIDLERHRMKGMGHAPLLFLPFFLLGFGLCLQQWRSSAHRAMLVAMLAAPFSAALTGIFVTRTLAMVVPITVLVCLGVGVAYHWIERWFRFQWFTTLVAVGLCAMSLLLLRSAVVEGPTWFRNYGMYGMQYGAAQIFGAVSEDLNREPDMLVVMSPTWANNTNAFEQFFLNERQQERLKFGTISDWLNYKQPIEPNQLFVLQAEEYEQARNSGKFVVDPPMRELRFPDGSPGFYFVRMHYVDNVDAVFAAERAARRKLQETPAQVDGETVIVRYSQIDAGEIPDLFDGDLYSLIRGFEANPFIIELEFPQPREISGLSMDFAKMDFELGVEITPAGGEPVRFSEVYRNLPGEPHADIALPEGPYSVSKLRIAVTNINESEPAHVHVRGLTIRR